MAVSPIYFFYTDPDEPAIAESLEELGLVDGEPVGNWIKLAQRLAADNGGRLPLESPELYPLPTVHVELEKRSKTDIAVRAEMNQRTWVNTYSPTNSLHRLRELPFRYSQDIWKGWKPDPVQPRIEKFLSKAVRKPTKQPQQVKSVGRQDLETDAYSGLVFAVGKHKRVSTRIVDRPIKVTLDTLKTPKLHMQVVIAERLTKRLNGFPSDSWLLKNGMSGILEAKKEHPEAFAHLLTK